MSKEQTTVLRKEINETKLLIEEELTFKLSDLDRQTSSFTNAKFNELKKKMEDLARSPRMKMSAIPSPTKAEKN
jgi:hypothetical protein